MYLQKHVIFYGNYQKNNLKNMKKKLLIAMGCSYTEGYGCWDLSTFPDEILDRLKNHTCKNPFFGNDNSNIELHTPQLISKNIDSFQKYGWPSNLSKLMGISDVINLGKGASSNSGQVKEFFKRKLHDNPYSDYDVTIVWLMTEPFRISFYIDGKIQNYMIESHPIWDAYFKEIISHVSDDSISNKIPLDDITLESVFYFNIMKTVCIKNNWNFYSFSLNPIFSKVFRKYELSDNFIDTNIFPIYHKENEYLFSNVCGHLNNLGYSQLAKNMYESISKK